jgi:hypothetical protein
MRVLSIGCRIQALSGGVWSDSYAGVQTGAAGGNATLTVALAGCSNPRLPAAASAARSRRKAFHPLVLFASSPDVFRPASKLASLDTRFGWNPCTRTARLGYRPYRPEGGFYWVNGPECLETPRGILQMVLNEAPASRAGG